MDLIIEGNPAELEWLRQEIEREVGAEAQLEAVPSQKGEELSEPLIIALIVALGGPKVVEAISDVIQRRYQHKEEIKRIDNQLRESEMKHQVDLAELRLRLRTDDGDDNNDREISEQDLASLEL